MQKNEKNQKPYNFNSDNYFDNFFPCVYVRGERPLIFFVYFKT